MIDDVVLKKATSKDLEYIQKLNRKLFVREFEKYNKLLNIEWTFGEKGTEYFKKLIKNNFVYVAKIDNNIIGYLAGSIHNINECFTERFAEIENMYIENQYRRLKIGSRLILKFKEWCRENKIAYIKVSAWSQNIEAINFYKNNDFTDYEKTLICKLEKEQTDANIY